MHATYDFSSPAPALVQMGQPLTPGALLGQRQQTDNLPRMREAGDEWPQDCQFSDFGPLELQAQG